MRRNIVLLTVVGGLIFISACGGTSNKVATSGNILKSNNNVETVDYTEADTELKETKSCQDIYSEIVALKKKDCSVDDTTGLYMYDGLVFLSDDSLSISAAKDDTMIGQGTFYKKIYQVINSYKSGSEPDKYSELITGKKISEFESTYEFYNLINRISEFMPMDSDLLADKLIKFKNVSHDVNSNNRQQHRINIADISSVVKEMGVTDRVFAYILGYMVENGANVEFSSNGSSVSIIYTYKTKEVTTTVETVPAPVPTEAVTEVATQPITSVQIQTTSQNVSQVVTETATTPETTTIITEESTPSNEQVIEDVRSQISYADVEIVPDGKHYSYVIKISNHSNYDISNTSFEFVLFDADGNTIESKRLTAGDIKAGSQAAVDYVSDNLASSYNCVDINFTVK